MLKGILYRKIVEEKNKPVEESLPGFLITKPVRFVEFPKSDDITKVNITYPLIEPFAYAQIIWNPENKELLYNILEPKISQEELNILKKISDGLIELVEVELSTIKEPSTAIKYLETNVTKVIKEFGIKLEPNQYIRLMYYVYRNFLGFNEIEPLLQDPYIEDISCDGNDTPIYVIHRKYGSLKTNIGFKDIEELREFIIKLAERTGRYVSYAEPILAGTLPNGSRVSANVAGDVSTRGPTFTIRKFTEKPISPIEQMELNTASSEILAYFWYLMEHGISLLIVGGVATGKTSFLNSVSMFIPPEAKIVSIEDTRELRLPHEHWIPGLARVGFGIPLPTGEKYGAVSLFDLLKESFRQNPDYVIVGEVRGAEAYVMFQGMSSGHPSISTFHAGSIDTMVKRLTSPPIDLSPTLIESLDTVAIMIHAKEKGKSARRIKEVIEIESVDPKTQEVKTRKVFEWDPITDTYKKVNESLRVKKIVESRGGTLDDALRDIETRKRILDWMQAQGDKDFEKVAEIINRYYKEPEKVMAMIGQEPIAIMPKRAIEVAVPVKPRAAEGAIPRSRAVGTSGKISILSLFGLKVLREK